MLPADPIRGPPAASTAASWALRPAHGSRPWAAPVAIGRAKEPPVYPRLTPDLNGGDSLGRFTFVVRRPATFHRVIPTKVGTSVTPCRDQTEVPALRGDDSVVAPKSPGEDPGALIPDQPTLAAPTPARGSGSRAASVSIGRKAEEPPSR